MAGISLQSMPRNEITVVHGVDRIPDTTVDHRDTDCKQIIRVLFLSFPEWMKGELASTGGYKC